jgi:hypothetical protein
LTDTEIDVKRAPIRHWFDVEIGGIPVNIKCTTTRSPDNAFNKRSIAETLLDDEDPEVIEFYKSPPSKIPEYLSEVARLKWRKVRNRSKELHYLVVKKDTRETLFISLLDVTHFVTNPSNILQINWKKEFENRSKCDADISSRGLTILKIIAKSFSENMKATEAFIKRVGTLEPEGPDRHSLGQYFTTSPILLAEADALVRNSEGHLLEPAAGAGHLVVRTLTRQPERRAHLFEIDTRLTESAIKERGVLERVTYTHGDFMTIPDATLTSQGFTTILGNPPYVKVAGGANLFVQFIEKCAIRILPPLGELVFIVPFAFFTSTGAAGAVLAKMDSVGRFTDLVLPRAERLFPGASVDVCIFRFVKDATLERSLSVRTADSKMRCSTTRLSYSVNPKSGAFSCFPLTKNSLRIGDAFSASVGFVSGRDGIFFDEKLGNKNLLVSFSSEKDLVHRRVIMVDSEKEGSPEAWAHLKAREADLRSRKIMKITDANWFKWMTRNATLVTKKSGTPCVFIKTKSRDATIAIAGVVEPFGGNLICLIPKEGETIEACRELASKINDPSGAFRVWRTCEGRFNSGTPRSIEEARV